ncbi:MAG TPA: hypothetical protein VGI75_03440, partial [Pirellulales bacterium]
RQLGVAWEAAYRLTRIRKEPPMTRFLANQLGRSHWFDISAAKRDFGFRPNVSTAEGMQRLHQWFSAKSWNQDSSKPPIRQASPIPSDSDGNSDSHVGHDSLRSM